MILDSIIEHWVRGLEDPAIRKEILRVVVTPNQSLAGVCNAAVQAIRLRKYEQDCENEERKNRELDFYRNLVRSNYSSETLESLMTSHNLIDASQL